MEVLVIIVLVAVIGLVDFLGDTLKEVKWLRTLVTAIVIGVLIAYVIKLLFF